MSKLTKCLVVFALAFALGVCCVAVLPLEAAATELGKCSEPDPACTTWTYCDLNPGADCNYAGEVMVYHMGGQGQNCESCWVKRFCKTDCTPGMPE